jgi:hypothetical protein
MRYTEKIRPACNNVDETSLNDILLPILFLLVISIVQHCSGSTMLNNMGSKILFKLVFINIVTGWAFFCCVETARRYIKKDRTGVEKEP